MALSCSPPLSGFATRVATKLTAPGHLLQVRLKSDPGKLVAFPMTSGDVLFFPGSSFLHGTSQHAELCGTSHLAVAIQTPKARTARRP